MITAHADLVAAVDRAQRHVTAAVDVDWWSDDADNLIANGDFEVDATGWLTNGFFSADASSSARSTARAYAGSGSLLVTWPTTTFGSEHGAFVTTVAGRKYLAEMRVYVPAGSPSVDIDVFVLGPGDASTATGVWQLLRKVFTATGTGHFVAVRRIGAATAGQQVYVDRVRCRPYMDLAPLAGVVRVSRSLAANLPDIAGIAAGDVSAEATVELAGVDPALPGSLSASAQLQPFNADSPLWRKERSGRPVTVEVGMLTDTGERRVRRFTGLTRSVQVDPASGAVTVTALDYAEQMRAPASLPTVVGSATISSQTYRPGLNGQWVVDYLLRQGGVNASPPQRPSCVLSATLHGSAAPEVGTLVSAGDSTSGNTVGYCAGKWALAAYDQATAPSPPVDSRYGEHVAWSARWQVSGAGLTSGTSAGMLVEGWVYLPAAAVARDLLTVESDPASGSRQKLVLRFTSAFVADWYTNAAGAAVTVTGPALSYDGAWHYLAALVSWPTTTTVRVTFRVDATSTTPADAAVAARTTQTAMTHVTVTSGMCMEALQVTSETPATAVPYDDEFAPSASLEPSLLELTTTPELSAGTSIWDVVKDIAAAEVAAVGFAEDGTAVYRGRRTAPDPPARTITADRSLSGFRTTERVDACRNRIRVPVSGYALQAAQFVWAAADVISVGSRATRTVIAEFAAPVVGLSTVVVVVPVGGNTSSRSGYRAARRPDGTGGTVTNLVFTVTALGTSAATVAVRNPNAYPIYLVSPTGAGYPSTSDGTPTLELWGQPITAVSTDVDGTTSLANSGVAEALWQPSIDLRGEQLLDVPASPWRQNADDAQALADDLLSLLHRPVPVIEQIDIAGDPTIQLGDRVVLSDPQYTGLNDPVIVVAIDETIDPAGGYGQSLTVRLVSPPGGWILGYADRSNVGTTTRI